MAFPQKSNLLRCIIAILAGHEHCHINEAEQLVLRAHPLHRFGIDTKGARQLRRVRLVGLVDRIELLGCGGADQNS